MSFSQAANALGHKTWSICDASQVDHMIEKSIKLSKLKKEIKDAMDEGSSSFFTAFGGLNVNCDFEVLNAENQPIKGLYAAGLEVSCMIGHTYTTWTSGYAFRFSCCSGRHAALNAVEKTGL